MEPLMSRPKCPKCNRESTIDNVVVIVVCECGYEMSQKEKLLLLQKYHPRVSMGVKGSKANN